MFIACHPVLSTEARVALTLRLLGGLTTDEIARAFLVPEPTVAQRIVRAKRTLAEAACRSRCPRGAERAARLASVLEVIYLIFNEGYAATAGDDWMRPALCEEALRLGRILAELAPQEPEVHGLVALMEIQASRVRARVGPAGEPILLLDQDRARWDQLLIRRGLAAWSAPSAGRRARPVRAAGRDRRLPRAGADAPRRPTGRASRRSTTALAALTPSPVVELNRAVAVAMAFGPAAGLELVDALTGEPSLADYHLLPSVARRSARQARPRRRGARGVRAGGRAHPERARARAPAPARPRVRGQPPSGGRTMMTGWIPTTLTWRLHGGGPAWSSGKTATA